MAMVRYAVVTVRYPWLTSVCTCSPRARTDSSRSCCCAFACDTWSGWEKLPHRGMLIERRAWNGCGVNLNGYAAFWSRIACSCWGVNASALKGSGDCLRCRNRRVDVGEFLREPRPAGRHRDARRVPARGRPDAPAGRALARPQRLERRVLLLGHRQQVAELPRRRLNRERVGELHRRHVDRRRDADLLEQPQLLELQPRLRPQQGDLGLSPGHLRL